MAEWDAPGLLLVVEGIDGGGKSTQIQFLADVFRSAGQQVLVSREPTDGPHGRRIRESAIHGRLSLEEELEAFTLDRRQHVREKIKPALDAGSVVILDRYFYSTAAYQGARGASADEILATNLKFAPEPDMVLLFDLAPEISLERIRQGREGTDDFEHADYLAKVRQVFLELAARCEPIVKLDASVTPNEVTEQIERAILESPRLHRNCPSRDACHFGEGCLLAELPAAIKRHRSPPAAR